MSIDQNSNVEELAPPAPVSQNNPETGPQGAAPEQKKRGRKPGSKNKPKAVPAPPSLDLPPPPPLDEDGGEEEMEARATALGRAEVDADSSPDEGPLDAYATEVEEDVYAGDDQVKALAHSLLKEFSAKLADPVQVKPLATAILQDFNLNQVGREERLNKAVAVAVAAEVAKHMNTMPGVIAKAVLAAMPKPNEEAMTQVLAIQKEINEHLQQLETNLDRLFEAAASESATEAVKEEMQEMAQEAGVRYGTPAAAPGGTINAATANPEEEEPKVEAAPQTAVITIPLPAATYDDWDAAWKAQPTQAKQAWFRHIPYDHGGVRLTIGFTCGPNGLRYLVHVPLNNNPRGEMFEGKDFYAPIDVNGAKIRVVRGG